jgi:hypothetical protein
MSDDLYYGGKLISTYSLWELGDFLKRIKDAEEKREAASKHKKFNNPNSKLVLPPSNPEYLKIKNAIELEIGKRQNA